MGLDGGFDGFITFVRKLRSDLKVPNTLTVLGAPRDEFEKLLSMALVDPTAGGNPIPLTAEVAREMLDAAFQG